MLRTRQLFKIGGSLAVTLPDKFIEQNALKNKSPIMLYHDGSFIVFSINPIEEEKLKQLLKLLE